MGGPWVMARAEELGLTARSAGVPAPAGGALLPADLRPQNPQPLNVAGRVYLRGVLAPLT
jgi:hypothetical protein